MAIRFAVANGNWSSTSTWNGGTLPTSADDVYTNNFNVTIDQNITVLSLNNISTTGVVAGGGFILNGGVTVTLNGSNAMQAGTTNLIVFSSSGTSTINCGGNVIRKPQSGSGISIIVINGGGSLSVTANIAAANTNAGTYGIFITSTAGATLNFVGNLGTYLTRDQSRLIYNNVSATISVVGNVYGPLGTGDSTVDFANGALSVLGDLYAGAGANDPSGVNARGGTVYVTGNLYGSGNTFNRGNGLFVSGATVSAYVTGNIYSTVASGGTFSGGYGSSAASYLYHIGTIYGGERIAAHNLELGATNILTGPFICSANGIFPFMFSRVFILSTATTYLQFRDSSNNGAQSPPSSPAPTYTLASVDIASAPLAVDVRQGVVYSGTLVGTLKVPSPDSVAKGVPTDNTLGTAALKPEDVWNYATANLTDANSIGARLKNVSTVETTGEQLEALL